MEFLQIMIRWDNTSVLTFMHYCPIESHKRLL